MDIPTMECNSATFGQHSILLQQHEREIALLKQDRDETIKMGVLLINLTKKVEGIEEKLDKMLEEQKTRREQVDRYLDQRKEIVDARLNELETRPDRELSERWNIFFGGLLGALSSGIVGFILHALGIF